jgi:ATP-dependent Clp protease ATP-binding subunit ClpC
MIIKTKQPLDIKKFNPQIERIKKTFHEQIIGQEPAIELIIESLSKLAAGICNKERPLLTLLFLGPTGVGKTETVKALANILFGKRNAFTRINCQEYSSEFTVSKLLGSPPGYVGNDVEPLLSQKNLTKYYDEAKEEKRGIFEVNNNFLSKLDKKTLNIVLFDELEKAHPKLWNAFLGIMDDGTLTLNNNKTIDFTSSIIVFTTNVGSSHITNEITNKSMGFSIIEDNPETTNKNIKEKVLESAKEIFPAEFLNRFDDFVCFRTLSDDDLKKVLKIMLQDVYHRLIESETPIILHYSKQYISHIIKEGTDQEFGARPMRRAVERLLVTPLSKLISSGQVKLGDTISVQMENHEPVFIKEKYNKKE